MKKILFVCFLVALTACGGNALDAVGDYSEGSLEDLVRQGEALALDGPEGEAKSRGLTDGVAIADGMVRVALTVPTAAGNVAARLYLSRECLLKRDRRLVALIPGTLANGGGYYEVAVPGREGFHTVRVLAKSGYCALSVDLLGTGGSFRPDVGQEVDSEESALAVAAVARPVATILGIPRWDVYGETGVGTNGALLLARRSDVRSVVVSAAFYLRFGPVSGQLFDPAFRAFVAATPYLPGDPALLNLFFGAAYPDVLAAAVAATLGPAPQTVPTGPFNEVAKVPFGFDPVAGEFVLEAPIQDAAPARADALFIQGSPDPIGSEVGTAELVAAYGASGGGEAESVTLPGASHLMRFDAPISDGPDSAFWEPFLSFLAAH